MKQKGFAPVIILVVIALGALGYFVYKYLELNRPGSTFPVEWATPTPTATADPTANWKTYTNLDWNYEIKVPNEWKQITQSARFNNHLGFNASDNTFLDISVNKLNLNSLEQYLEIIDKEGKDQVKILETKIITPNIMIERKEEMLEAGMNQLVFYTIRNNYIVRLSLISADGNISKIESFEVYKYYNQILSTFKFLNSPKNTVTVKLYYHDSKLDPNGDFCEANNYTEKDIPKTNTPIKDAINTLIHSDIFEKDDRFILKSINLKQDGTLVLEFPWIGGFTTGGSCRIGILMSQIEKTALQFSEVKKVTFEPEVFQP